MTSVRGLTAPDATKHAPPPRAALPPLPETPTPAGTPPRGGLPFSRGGLPARPLPGAAAWQPAPRHTCIGHDLGDNEPWWLPSPRPSLRRGTHGRSIPPPRAWRAGLLSRRRARGHVARHQRAHRNGPHAPAKHL